MKIQFDAWFEQDEIKNIQEIVEYAEEKGEILFDLRKTYPDGIKGSRFGGVLTTREIKDEFTIKLLKDIFKIKGLMK